MPAPTIRAVAFDFDETLYDRRAAVDRLLRAWLPGISAQQADQFHVLDGSGYGDRLPLFRWLCGEMAESPAAAMTLEARFRQELPAFLIPDDDAVPVLESLKARGFTLAVLTNGQSVYQRAKLAASGLLPHFSPDCVLVTGEVGWHKPDARAFAALVQACGCSAAETLYIGDHVVNDITGARASGLQTAWLRRRHPGGTHPDADHVIDSLSDLAGIPALGQPLF